MVGIDANALTYLVKATSGKYDPATDEIKVANQRVAMCRIFLYGDDPLCLTPTVEKEYEAIRNDDAKRHSHWDLHRFHIIDALPNGNPQAVEERVDQLVAVHADREDCSIAAEAECSNLGTLLSFDQQFARLLNPVLRGVQIIPPSEHWHRLDVPRGVRPRWQPAPGNPLAEVDWWRW